MSGLTKTALPALAILAMLAAPQAWAQWRAPTAAPEPPATAAPPPQGTSRGENFSAGKSPAQLFASDCTGAGCHKGPQGLAKDRGQLGLASFLREHYTNSRESAAALAAYLAGVPGDARAAKPTPERQPRAAARPDDTAKPDARRQPAEPPDARPDGKPAQAQKPPRGRQATVTPASPPAAAPAAAPEPPAPPPEPPKPQWDIFD